MILTKIFILILYLAYVFSICSFVTFFEVKPAYYIATILYFIDLILFIVAKVIGIEVL